MTEQFDSVIVTVPSWILETRMQVEGFTPAMLPQTTINAYRDYSARSGLYFAGESFSVDAGWTEPAMRGAVDAVITLCANQGAAFNGGFDLAHYPRYGVEP